MKYLVEMKAVESGENTKEMMSRIEDYVFPSFKQLIGWEKEDRIHGGNCIGRKKGSVYY